MSSILAAEKLDVGTEHIQVTIGNLVFNLDTLWASAVAGILVVLFGLSIARRATSGVPKGPQLIWETVVGNIEDQVESSMGVRVAPFVVPLATALFFFILFANWLELVPTYHASGTGPRAVLLHLPSPTADVNLTFALAVVVIVWVHVTGVRKRGAGHYFAHFFKPALLSPINIIEELVKPVTLALRLFGNVFAGGVMISVIALLPSFLLWAPNIAWKLFDMAIGVIQAFIFALLTILYFSFAIGGVDELEDHQEDHEDSAALVDETAPVSA